MNSLLAIENIEALRHQVGIDDVELKTEISGLEVGDLVRITFVSGRVSFETLVRITRIRNADFWGELTGPSANRVPELPIGLPISFSAHHIHSIPGKRRA